jgi:uncharacterized membrane protein
MWKRGSFGPRRLAVIGLLLALMLIFGFTPLGFIPVTPVVSITLLHIPVLVGLLCEGFGTGMLLGLLFGLLSLARALWMPSGLLSPFFLNPLISVLPRLWAPCAAWGAYRGASALLGRPRGKDRPGQTKARPVAWACAAVAGTLANTVGVLGMLWLVYGTTMLAETFQVAAAAVAGVLGGIVLTNGLAETAFAALVVPALLGALVAARIPSKAL